MRLGILTTHPIQYYAPWFRSLARELDLLVMYAVPQTPEGQAAAGFGVEFEWDVPLLEGYPYRWLENVSRRPAVGTFSGANTPGIGDLVREERFDALLVFGWNYRSALQAFRACRRHGVPVLFRGDSQLETRRSWVKRVVKWAPYRFFLTRASAHLYVGTRNEAYLRHYGVRRDRLFFSPHFVDAGFFARRAEEARRGGANVRVRSELGFGSEDFVFLFVGKLLREKRVDDLLRALRLLRGRSDQRCFGLVVGDGPDRERLERFVQDHRLGVRFLGFRNQSELPTLYAAADCLVLPSTSETWGLVVNEAMTCGLPAVVSSGVGCGPDLIEEGETGYTYPDGDMAALAERLSEVGRLVRREPGRVREALERKMEVYSMERATRGLRSALDHVCA